MNHSHLKPRYWILVIAILNIFAFLTLYLIRSVDDNRLTSWKWVFVQTDVVPIVAYLILGLVLAYALSTISSLERYPMGLFLASFFIAIIFWTEPELIVDSSRYFTQAKQLRIYGIGYFFREWGRDIMAWTDLPLVPFLYGLIFKFFGEQRLYIQIFTTLLFSLTVVLTYLIGRILWDERTGFVGASLLLGIPYLFSQVPLMLVDIPTMFFLTLSIFTMIKALENGGTSWIGVASLAVFFTFFSKYSTWLWLSVLPIIFMVFLRKAPLVTVRRAGMVALLSFCLISVVLLFKYDVLAEQIRLLMSYQRPGLKRWGESFISTFLFQAHPFIALAAIYSIYVAIRKRELKYAVVAYLPLLLLLLQIKRIRYTLPILPMVTLMASYGLMQIKNRETRRFIVSCTVISSVLLATFAYLPFLQRISAVNLKDAGKFVNSLDVDRVEIFTLPQKKSIINPSVAIPILDLFTDKRISYDMEHDSTRIGARIKKSALRFTWAYKNPEYYRARQEDSAEAVLVVISSDPDQTLPADIEERAREYRNSKAFSTLTGVFRYKTLVTVYYD